MTYRVALRKTEDEALAGIQDAIALYLGVAADLARDGAAEMREVDVAA